MSLPLALRSQEDSNMEEAITVRDKNTAMAQAHPTVASRARDTPAADLWKPTTLKAKAPKKVRKRDPKRITRSSTSMDLDPFETPTRVPTTTVRRSGSDGDMSDASYASTSSLGEMELEDETPRAPRTEVLVQGMRGLAAQTHWALQSEARTRIQQHQQVVQGGQQLVEELQGKFREVEGHQGQTTAALNTLASQFQAYALAQQTETELRFRQMALENEQQQRRTQELAAYIQAQQAEKSLELPEGMELTIQAAQAAPPPKAPSPALDIRAELQKMLKSTKQTLRGKGKQPTVVSAEDSPGEGRAPPPSPPANRRDKSPSPPPRRSHGKRRREEEPAGSEKVAGTSGGNGGGRGRRRHRRDDSPSSSDSSSSSEGDRKRRRRDRHHRRAETQSPEPHHRRKGETPKQAKIPFSGKPDEDVRHWIDRMEILMDLQPRVTWDDKTRILWASLEFSGSAASFWRNFKERLSIEPRLGTWERFKQELRIQYGNRTSQEQAKQKMDNLRQKGPIDDYINEMQNLEWDARVGPIVMKSMILTGINSSLEQRLSAAIEEPSEFPDWLAWVRKVGRKDAEVKARQQILRGREPAKPHDHPEPKRQRPPRPPNKKHKEPRPHEKERENSPHRPRPATGSLGATQAEKDQWAKENKCLRCGREGHWTKECYSAIKARATSGTERSSGRKRKREKETSRTKEPEEGNEKRQKMGPQGEAFRARITALGED